MSIVTYEDIRKTPESNALRYEIIGGELFITTSPTTTHQRVSLRLTRAFDRTIVESGQAEVFYALVDVKFSEYDVVVPDLLAIAAERRDIIQESFIAGPPDLIVEILSPSTWHLDQARKPALYATMGVREYWLVDLKAKIIDVLALDNGVYESTPQEPGTVRSLIFPTLTVDLKALFEELT